MFGDAIFGDLIFGGGSLSATADTDTPSVNVIINDLTGRITYVSRGGVKILTENSGVYIFNEEPTWVKILG